MSSRFDWQCTLWIWNFHKDVVLDYSVMLPRGYLFGKGREWNTGWNLGTAYCRLLLLSCSLNRIHYKPYLSNSNFKKFPKFVGVIYSNCYCELRNVQWYSWGRYSSVGIATRYGLDGPGIESRWARDFPHPSRPALGPIQPPIQWVPGLSRG